MSYNDDDFSPRWCMSSQEVGSGIAFLIALCLAGFILLPAFLLGMHIGAKVWNVKIVKYLFGSAFAGLYGYSIYLLYSYVIPSLRISLILSIITLSWLILDYIMANHKYKQMWVSQSVLKSYRWLFSA